MDDKTVLLPRPQQLTREPGHFTLPAAGTQAFISLGRGDRDIMLRVGRLLQKAFASASGNRPQLTASAADTVLVEVEARDQQVGTEGYTLSIRPDGVQLSAVSDAGLFYGAQTLIQLVRANGVNGALPCLTIRDWPDLSHRAVQLDISRRRIPTMESLKRFVDRLSHLKVNQLQLYTEHTFAYHNHRAVWEDYSPMTGEQVLELDQYCRERFVELVPNQNTFGHMERWLNRPEYEHLAEGMPGMPIQYYLCPSDPKSLALVEELLEELLPHFSSRQAMVGLDEVTLGDGGRSQALCRQLGGPDLVYLDYLKKVDQIVSRHGRTMMYFADMMVHYRELIPRAPQDAIGLIWGYDEDYDFSAPCAAYAQGQIPFYTVPSTCCFASIGGRFQRGMVNMADAVEAAIEHGGEGCLVCNWGDGGYWQPLSVSMVGYAYGAGVMWNLEGNKDADLARALDANVWLDSAGVVGKLAVDLGNAYLQLPELADWSAYQTILQQKPGGHEQLARISQQELEEAESYISRTMAPLGKVRMACADAEIVAEEFRVASGLMIHACHLAQARHVSVGETMPQLPQGWGISHIVPANKTSEQRAAEKCYYWPERPGDAEIPTYGADRLARLATEMEALIADYQSVWLVANRPGGLAESCERFERLLKLYGQA